MNFSDSNSSEEFYSPLSLSNLDLSPLKEVRFRSESDIECELKFFKDPNYIPSPTPCSESYETKEMSSEETLSVGGSKEVRMLEYNDVAMESGSFGSKRTRGGWGYKSELGTRDSLVYLVETYDLPPQVLIRPAGVEERACSAPQDHWMPMYAHYLAAGLRFPMLELLVWLLLEYRIAESRKEKGWYYFTRQSSNKEKRNLFSARPSSIKGWKEKFFFVDDTDLNSDEEEKVEKLVRKEGDMVDIMFLTNSDVIEATKLYGPSLMSEAKMDKFLGIANGMAIPKKPRKKSKTSKNVANEGRAGDKKREQPSSSSARAPGVQPRPELKRKRSEDLEPPQKKKKKTGEQEVRGDEVAEFVPRPSLVKLDLEVREIGVTTHGKGKALVLPPLLQNSLFDTKNTIVMKNFLNAYLPEVDCRRAKEKEKDEMYKELDEVVPTMTSLQDERNSLKIILSFKERKRKMCGEQIEAQDQEIKEMKKFEAKLKKNVKLLVHNGMEEHIVEFINSSTFENIVNLYRLPTAILAFTDCRKKIKLRWDHDKEGCTVFPPNFDFEFVVVEEGEGEVEGTKVKES
ncbi:hypothetical protein SLEP1_g51111 [Rubroshorea leprosula]|uniref:Uncharacterized protein n=1 Tax=Rubroshorea leprosula TaxID=152421 RepID=A0AAV5M2D0_9ROSI|nr:hypothetical protein SLEP1_g51111 [Rubroshorea leprosula]